MQPTTPAGPMPAGPRLARAVDGRVVAGVARGLADHLSLDVTLVRVLFAVLAPTGAGLLLYGLLWVFAPQAEPSTPAVPRPRRPGPADARLAAVAAVALAGGLAIVAARVGLGLDVGFLVPLGLVTVGVLLAWQQADDTSRAWWRDATGATRWTGLLRVGGGALLVASGLVALLAGKSPLSGIDGALVAGLVAAAGGMAVVTAPFWVRLVRDLAAERSARIREQERAEIAAHLHDSVLHTLALIQRHVEEPREVARLARAQERELRTWLYTPSADPDATLAAAVQRTVAEVEDAHSVKVDLVTVGDAPLDGRSTALVAATREALVNAAKYAGAGPISVYAEVEPESVSVFVRDHGPGFDLDAVPDDRLGIRQSIVGRMNRHGGGAEVRSTGDGTEVALTLPLAAPRPKEPREAKPPKENEPA